MNHATSRLTVFERCVLWCLAGVLIIFGGLVEIRSAFLKRRMSDLTVFIRAGWAVRTGENIYEVSDEGNGWYYVYPPLFAICMAPLAEAPPGADQTGLIPYPISVAIWYLFSVGVLFWGVHRLASALERTAADPEIRNQPAGCRRWWWLRLAPILVFLVPVGSTLSHGQTNLLILAMLCAMFAALLEGKSFQAGLWMAGPICMKVFPAFLLIYPLWRRDFRCLAACSFGLFFGLAAIPATVYGPAQTASYYEQFTDLVLLPGVGKGDNAARADTLTAITATDTQSFMAMIHNAMYPSPSNRPPNPAAWVRAVHWGLGAALTLLVCLTAGWRRSGDPRGEALFLGLLMILMMFLSPVCHLPYFAWFIPIVMILLTLTWEHRTNLALGAAWLTLIGVNLIVHALAHSNDYAPLQMFRDLGFASYVGLVFAAIALVRLRGLVNARMAVSVLGEQPINPPLPVDRAA